MLVCLYLFQVISLRLLSSPVCFFSFQCNIFRDTFQKRISEIFVVNLATEMVDAIADSEVLYVQNHVITYNLVEYGTCNLDSGGFILYNH